MTIDDQRPDALELLRCAQANFDNLVTVAPSLPMHPFYAIARMQLNEAVTALEEAPSP